MRLDRDPPLYDVFRHFGSAKKVADFLGISTQAVSHWKRVPAKYLYTLSQPTGIHPYKLRPDLYVESFWMSGMDTALIAKAMSLEEAEVYRILSSVLERRRTQPNVDGDFTIPAVSQPIVESGEGRESIPVPAVHGVAQSDDVGDTEPNKE
jgi:hypothetical protein